MTQKIFNILEFCTTWLRTDCFGIFQDQYISRFIDDIPENDDKSYNGMWLYYIASVNMIASNWGYVADDVIKIGSHKFVYLYRLE